MGDGIALDASLIEQHYESIITATQQCTDPITVIYDDETNISVKTNSKSVYERSVELEGKIESCINADAENLAKLGRVFLSLDAGLATDINNMLSFE